MHATDAITTQSSVTDINPFEAGFPVNNILEFSPYLKENITVHHYKD
jgi:hypothetical protein